MFQVFPRSGVFLAVGEKLVGKPVIGLWLSSALACAALIWMLQAWISPGWALLGGLSSSFSTVSIAIGARPIGRNGDRAWRHTLFWGVTPSLGAILLAKCNMAGAWFSHFCE